MLDNYKLKKERTNNDGILVPGTNNPQYKEAIFTDFKLTTKKKNCCCLLNYSTIIEIYNFAFSTTLNTSVFIGKKYNVVQDFYVKPCKSSVLGIYYVENINSEFGHWPITDICHKLARFPYKSGFVVFPLLHTID